MTEEAWQRYYKTRSEMDIFLDARAEMQRQDEKWGQQDHQDGTCMYGDHEAVHWAKVAVDLHAKNGTLTWRDILMEEIREAFDESDPQKLDEELNQCMAVIAQWRLAIRRRSE